ncbi:MAG: urea ABC transporter permease subunit UrtB [Rhizobiaceae bacterium]
MNAALADEDSLRAALSKFNEGEGYAAIEAGVAALGATGDPAAAATLNALSSGLLVRRKADGAIFITDAAGTKLIDPSTGADAGEAAPAEIEKLKIKNSIRKKIGTALSGMTLMSPNRAARLSAAETIFQSGDPAQLAALETAIAAEMDASVKARFEQAKASVILATSTDQAALTAAVATIAARGDRESLKILHDATGKLEGEAATVLANSISGINNRLAIWNVGQNIWYGISLGSVLLLAAIGLAITFGVMGVINMAHGEMVMLGAYTTFVVQQFLVANAPELIEYGLAFALPLAFLVSATVGMAIERTIIRQLYGRPLETLLATWGVSLILQQGVRSIFGATNREVSNPSWMSDGFMIGQMTITWNRFWILVFALTIFFALLLVLKRTAFGLQMRAVTQNRRMASSMGIATPWVDAFTFALGSGIAGIAGVALSQIDNVSPDLGQSYIIDSFMVVVFGGVGNLWGTLVGALSLGVANKFLEPYAGAVLAKILVLVLIILFIQKRPRGLFAIRGRAVEA